MILMCHCGRVKIAAPWRSSAVKKWVCDIHKANLKAVRLDTKRTLGQLKVILDRHTISARVVKR